MSPLVSLKEHPIESPKYLQTHFEAPRTQQHVHMDITVQKTLFKIFQNHILNLKLISADIFQKVLLLLDSYNIVSMY